MEKRCSGAAPSIADMTSIDSITLEVADPTAARDFYTTAFGLGPELQLRASDAATTGFRGFTLSLTVSQPATAGALIDSAVAAGAVTLKPAAKSLWGFGGVVQAPDGTIFISYDRNRSTDGEILLARFTEADVLSKRLTGPTSKLKMLISRPLAPKKKGA